MEKIKVGAVSYLNTKPLLYGIYRSSALMQQIELVEDYPANIAKMLIDGAIDIGLAPVAIIPKLNEWHIDSKYGIAANGAVASVCLFSDVALNDIETILLDYQSRTSVALCQALIKRFWKINPEFKNAEDGYIENIKGRTAGVVIGDRALTLRGKTRFVYDLAEAWKAFTGLPFLFAAWISNKKLPADFITLFDEANSVGLHDLNSVIAEQDFSNYDLHTYYTDNIKYEITDEVLEGMKKFLELLGGEKD